MLGILFGLRGKTVHQMLVFIGLVCIIQRGLVLGKVISDVLIGPYLYGLYQIEPVGLN